MQEFKGCFTHAFSVLIRQLLLQALSISKNDGAAGPENALAVELTSDGEAAEHFNFYFSNSAAECPRKIIRRDYR